MFAVVYRYLTNIPLADVELASADQALLRGLPVAVLQEHREQREGVEMHALATAHFARRQAGDRFVELSESPALLRIFDDVMMVPT